MLVKQFTDDPGMRPKQLHRPRSRPHQSALDASDIRGAQVGG